MGVKEIWDGKQLPPIGCDVLIHLASLDRWLPYRVTGYEIWPDLDGNRSLHRIFINVKSERHNGSNQRLLCDVRPVDWREHDDPL